MRKRKQKKVRAPDEVELNMAAMLDMAFQLLAFFILTFRPSPVESQISLRMPNSATTAAAGQTSDQAAQEAPGLQLTISVHASDTGEIAGIEVGSQTLAVNANPAETITALRATLKDALTAAEFESIALLVSDDLNYERMMQVLDVCSHQTLPNGEQMTKISIDSLRGG